MPQRGWQVLMMAFACGLSWLGMMAVHELGHVVNARLSGGRVERVVLHPLAISRTDVAPNPHPLFVAWGGAAWGTAIPLVIWIVARLLATKYAYLARFFAGFCCIANGLYLAVGSLDRVGDAGDLLRHGATAWQLWLFGLAMSIFGLWLWNGLGPAFGFGPSRGHVDRTVVRVLAAIFAIAVLLEVAISALYL